MEDRSLVGSLRIAALLVTAAACRQRVGHVHVTHPEVFGRERLVAERLREVQWLESQYDTFDEDRREGELDSRRQRALSIAGDAAFQDAVGLVLTGATPPETDEDGNPVEGEEGDLEVAGEGGGAVAALGVLLDEAALAQLRETLAEHARRHGAAGALQGVEAHG